MHHLFLRYIKNFYSPKRYCEIIWNNDLFKQPRNDSKSSCGLAVGFCKNNLDCLLTLSVLCFLQFSSSQLQINRFSFGGECKIMRDPILIN